MHINLLTFMSLLEIIPYHHHHNNENDDQNWHNYYLEEKINAMHL